MSKGTQYSQQSYKVSDSFPFKWINKKWREGLHVTSMATAGIRWVVVMSRNAGYSDQLSSPNKDVENLNREMDRLASLNSMAPPHHLSISGTSPLHQWQLHQVVSILIMVVATWQRWKSPIVRKWLGFLTTLIVFFFIVCVVV